MRIFIMIILGCVITLNLSAEEPTPHRKLTPVEFHNVKIQDEFWQPRLKVNHEKTVWHNIEWCEKTGRIRNFAKAAGMEDGEFEGIYFNDSDVYKVLEGASYSLALFPDDALEAKLDEIIEKIANAQEENGYLNTYYTLEEPDKRWSDLKVKHELYCAGHLIEAGIAHYQATDKRTLLDVAIKFADLIDEKFGLDKRRDVPGHEELELALIKLYHLTGEKRYLDLSQFFIEERGHAHDRELYGNSLQDHAPIREQDQVFGHAVRAMYLFSGVADVASITGDPGYLVAMSNIWNDLVSHKMYVTGGIGVSGHGEGFAGGYDLPNENSYAETCASIALAFFNHRMNLIHADSRYADVFERVLYNGLLSGVSMDGDKFFYRNPLASDGPESFQTSGGKQGDSEYHRQHWFNCACCPTNVVRFIPKIGEYIYAYQPDGIYINQYIASQTMIPLSSTEVEVTIKSQYPWEGNIQIHLTPKTAAKFDLNLRIPSWCNKPSIRVNGEKIEYRLHAGYVRLDREWNKNEIITLNLPMEIKRIQAHPYVKADRAKVALQRGPLVYCLEEMDNPVGVKYMALHRDAELEARYVEDLLSGVVVITGEAIMKDLSHWNEQLYQPVTPNKTTPFMAVPYYSWDNRTPGEMVVWLPEHADLTLLPTLATQSEVSASHVGNGDSLAALNDQREPNSSNDKSIPRFTWWDRKGTKEWIQYNFFETSSASAVEVYWYDDRDKGDCRVPESWKLLYKDKDSWKEIKGVKEYPTERNGFNYVSFAPIKTKALRVQVQLQEDYSAGILEWAVYK